ncbi:Branched-chain alpha-keto acid dehydrogenase [Carbonactinospora thermoautotrophica]|uniref:Branched-chain alpha-keto acid dehydrogenase n=1 Tax=Carbonactinospora thermoautotrophica TaxID=1469144 RepID=A0A132MMT3_9ACTN|nr:pyruvate dehydrogenase (acetyl-transferring) E1 component subunit alpha [Carbonactinospora thermoautotrophica]KWW99170.1 Branched-chain alpha-keto acid dehydrogenase [Carbonactinospora thermoautotrophica]
MTVLAETSHPLPLEPVQLLDEHGDPADGQVLPPAAQRLQMYRRLVVGRRFDRQAAALTRQGRLAVYPSSNGQEACQVGAVLAVRDTDWLFPTYRESVALVTRGIDPVEVLTLLRGDWHCGYDPYHHRTAPQCTPLATQALHAVGLAHAARLAGDDVVALAFVGDGATSEGDCHEALNFAAVYRAPVVFFVQNNQYAISVPLAKQTAASSLAHKAIGYGMPGRRVDGNDVLAVYRVVRDAVEHARAGQGPTLVEAVTYRMDAHTNADDASRYRTSAEVDAWRKRDPITRLERHLRAVGVLDDAGVAEIAAEAEDFAARLRERMNTDPVLDPMEMFRHVYAEPTPQLREQAALLAAELAAEAEAPVGGVEARA